jgi:hypothetical protein
MFTGCGADPTETYNEQVSKIAELSDSDKGTVEINIDCDLASTDEKMTLESLLAGADEDAEFDFGLGVTAAWSGDKASMDLGLSGDNLISIYGDTESLCLDISKLSGVLSELGLDSEITTELSKLFTTIKFNYEEIQGLVETFSGESIDDSEADLDAAEAKGKVVAVLTDEDLMSALKSLGEKATIKEGKIEIHDISKDDLKKIADALEASVEKNDMDDLLSSIDNPTIIPDDIENDEEKTVTIDYSLSYDDDKLDQVHEIKVSNDSGDKVTFEIKVKDSDSGLNDLSEKAKTFDEIMGCSVEDYITKLMGSLMSGMMTGDNYGLDQQDKLTDDIGVDMNVLDELDDIDINEIIPTE